ncbi:MAG: hypothetical protein WD042_09090 [Phycisphaeraceae bacterium]
MSRRRIVTLGAVSLVIVGGIALAVVAVIGRAMAPANDVRVYEPAPFASAAEASKASGIPLPPEAKSVRVASWSQWIGHATYMRFDAPVAVCLRHAAVLVPDEALAPVAARQLADDATPPEPGIFRDVSWFDLGAAQNVVAAGGGSQRPRVWVDRTRGVLYYRLTD